MPSKKNSAEMPPVLEEEVALEEGFTEERFDEAALEELASKGLGLKTETVYRAKLQYLIDLTFEPIPNVQDALFSLLPETAPGYRAGELKKQVLQVLEKAAKQARMALRTKSDVDLPEIVFDKPAYDFLPIQNLTIEVTSEFSVDPISAAGYLSKTPLLFVDNAGMTCLKYFLKSNLYDANKKYTRLFHNYTFRYDELKGLAGVPQKNERYDELTAPLHALFAGNIDPQALAKADIRVQILYYIWYIATKMISEGAIMPRLVVSQNYLYCHWLPATIHEDVRELVTKLGIFMMGYEHLFFNRKDRSVVLNPLYVGELYLNLFIQNAVSVAYPQKISEELDILLDGLGHNLETDLIEDKSVQLRIESWLSALNMKSSTVTPVMRFYDLNEKDVMQSSLFMNLNDEIIKVADEEKKLQMQAISQKYASDSKFQRKVDEFVSLSYNEGDEEDLEDAYESFSKTDAVAIEIGFVGVDESIKEELYERGLIDDSGIVSLTHIINEPCCKDIQYECIRTACRIASITPNLQQLFSSQNNICILPLSELYDTLTVAQKGLALLGVRIIMPRALKKMLLPQSSVRIGLSIKGFDNSSGLLSLSKMLDFSWELAIGDKKLSSSEFNVLLANSGRIVRFHDTFVYADPDLLLKLKDQIKKQEKLQENPLNLLTAALTRNYGDHAVSLTEGLRKTLELITTPSPIDPPQGLKASLRPYQQRGYEWLMHNMNVSIGSILADDMGLGKTLQVITALLKLKEDGRLDSDRQALIVVPTSLLTNWHREITNFAPSLSVSIMHGTTSKLDKFETDVVVTSYGYVRTRNKELNKKQFAILVVDEAQAIKNRNTSVNKAVSSLKADYYIAMSGTPVENHLIEYFSILDFTNRGLFGSAENFKRDFANPIENNRDMSAVNRFKNLTAPFIMRRLKSDKNIINDLPDKIVCDQFCTLTPNQTALYESVVNETMNKLNDAEKGTERNAMLLMLINRLRAICNSPAQFEKSEENYPASDSGKVERLLELIDELSENNGKALIFTQSVIMGNYLVKILEEHTGRAPQFLHGGVALKDRMMMVDSFQNDPNERFMLLSLKAAGTGLNLTAANCVIHFDLWWNPAVENQATDRAYRIGQKKNVEVYRFICANTFEERINELINSKKELAELTVHEGESWIGNLSNRQLNALFALSKPDN